VPEGIDGGVPPCVPPWVPLCVPEGIEGGVPPCVPLWVLPEVVWPCADDAVFAAPVLAEAVLTVPSERVILLPLIAVTFP
jgi:hypothetical protein